VLRLSVSEAASLHPGVSVRTEITEGLAARVLLDHAQEADMLVLGRTAHGPDPSRGAGPVIRVCLRAASCPVVIIGAAAAAEPDPGGHIPESWQRTLEDSAAAR
jgi:nucleotide-binding universal stress UspA family protein